MLWRMPVDTRTRGSAACSTLGLRPSYPAFVSAKRKTHPASPSTRTVCLVARRPILAVVSIRQRIRRYDPTAPVGDGSRPAQTPLTAPSAIVPVAAGDLACEGMRGGCDSGGDWGTTAAYRVEGRNLCVKCAVKQLGYQDEPGSTLPGLLEPWSLSRK